MRSLPKQLNETIQRENPYVYEMLSDLGKQIYFPKGRANRVKYILDSGKYDDVWEYYPFNSGYFMCLKLKTVDAETLRLHLLDNIESVRLLLVKPISVLPSLV